MISKLDNLIRIKLFDDLSSELMHDYKTKNIFNNKYTEKEFEDIIKNKIQEKIKQFKISMKTGQSTKEYTMDQNICSARIMGPHYSDLRCMRKCHDGNEYCKHHLKRINEYDYLSFGRYDQPRPKINEKGTKIPWRDSSPMEDMNTIILYQESQLRKLISNK